MTVLITTAKNFGSMENTDQAGVECNEVFLDNLEPKASWAYLRLGSCIGLRFLIIIACAKPRKQPKVIRPYSSREIGSGRLYRWKCNTMAD